MFRFFVFFGILRPFTGTAISKPIEIFVFLLGSLTKAEKIYRNTYNKTKNIQNVIKHNYIFTTAKLATNRCQQILLPKQAISNEFSSSRRE